MAGPPEVHTSQVPGRGPREATTARSSHASGPPPPPASLHPRVGGRRPYPSSSVRKAFLQATRGKSPAHARPGNTGAGPGAGRRTLRMTSSDARGGTHARLALVAGTAASMAAERKTKLSKNLLRMKVRGMLWNRAGMQSARTSRRGQGRGGGQTGHLRGPRRPPALVFIHRL
jgi:hypothetical protein